MNSRERVLTALSVKQPDRVPVIEPSISESTLKDIAQVLGIPASGLNEEEDFHALPRTSLDLYCAVVGELGLDAYFSSYSIGMKTIAADKARDDYGVVYQLSPHGQPVPIEGPVKELADAKSYNIAEKLGEGNFEKTHYIMQQTGREKAHIVSINDPFKLSWYSRGNMEAFLLDYIINPQLVDALADLSTDYILKTIEIIAKLGADAVFMGGDLASEANTLMSPEHFRRYIKPYYRIIVEFAHGNGLKVIKHSDGNIWPILDDLLDVEFDAINPIQPQCMDIGEVKRYVGKRSCIVGNIDCRDLLCNGSIEQVEDEVKETIAKAAYKGGYVASSSNSIHPGVKAENYLAMIRAVHKYGNYD